MHTPTSFGLLALVSLISASPLPQNAPALQEGSIDAFSVGQIAVHGNWKNKLGQVQYLKSLRKFNAEIPAEVKNAAAAAVQSGSVPNQPEANDQEYLSNVQIGSQTIPMDFDTGSSDFWVFSNELPASESSGHTVYNTAGKSQLAGETWKIQYGDGSGAQGNIFSDRVVIGGVTATSQAVEAATSVSSSFTSDTQNDGLVGLGFDSINTATPNKVPTFFDNVRSSLPQPLFCAYLKHAATGSYDFGFINTAHYSGNIGYANVNTANGFWEFTAGTYSVGGTATGTLGDSIADTGTSIILVPSAVSNAYYRRVSGAGYSNSVGGYIFPCSSTLPTFSVQIGGTTITVPGSYINYATVGSGYCYGGIQYNGGLPFSILGDVFLKSAYVVFDAGVPRVGFAQQR